MFWFLVHIIPPLRGSGLVTGFIEAIEGLSGWVDDLLVAVSAGCEPNCWSLIK
jgi:hypothetical protein